MLCKYASFFNIVIFTVFICDNWLSLNCILPFHEKTGGFRISGKGVHMYKGMGVRFVDFIAFLL